MPASRASILQAMSSTYAVVWNTSGDTGSGQLETFADRLELRGRDRSLSIPLGEVTGASIVRSAAERLRGLPVLVLGVRNREPVQIASLEGVGLLRELADRIARAGVGGTTL
jgi:hypothetical protein